MRVMVLASLAGVAVGLALLLIEDKAQAALCLWLVACRWAQQRLGMKKGR